MCILTTNAFNLDSFFLLYVVVFILYMHRLCVLSVCEASFSISPSLLSRATMLTRLFSDPSLLPDVQKYSDWAEDSDDDSKMKDEDQDTQDDMDGSELRGDSRTQSEHAVKTTRTTGWSKRTTERIQRGTGPRKGAQRSAK